MSSLPEEYLIHISRGFTEMKDTTKLEALVKSIRHWEDNLERAKAGKDISVGPYDCALCRLYFVDDCMGCPVSKKTGSRDCVDTPYYDVVDGPQHGQAHLTAIEAEIDFLKSLVSDNV